MITISKEEIMQCYNFATTAWNNKSQSAKQFGTPELREKNAFIADQIFGKLAEYVFKYTIIALNKSIQVHLDFSHYPDQLHTDNGDVEIIVEGESLPLKIDVKGSSYKAQWLLVEIHKYNDPQTGMKVSDRYVMVKFSEKVPDSQTLRNNPELILDFSQIEGEVIGWANHSDFSSEKDQKAWFSYDKGQKPYKRKVLPNSSERVNNITHLNRYINKVITNNNFSEEEFLLNLPLEAKLNVGLPVSWLYTDLKKILEL